MLILPGLKTVCIQYEGIRQIVLKMMKNKQKVLLIWIYVTRRISKNLRSRDGVLR